MVELNNNMVTPSTFELSIGKIPTSTMDKTKDVLLQLFGTVIPGMDINEIEQYWQGQKSHSDSGGGILWGDWTVSYFLNSGFSNWRTLYDWMMLIARGNIYPPDHNIHATLFVKDNFDNIMLNIEFTGVWLKNLGEVTLNTQSGDDFLQSTATFSYNQFLVYTPNEPVSGGTDT